MRLNWHPPLKFRALFSAQMTGTQHPLTHIPGPNCEASWTDNATRTLLKTSQPALLPTRPLGRHLLSPKLVSPGCAHVKIQTILGTLTLLPRQKGPPCPQCNSLGGREHSVPPGTGWAHSTAQLWNLQA